MDEWDYRVFWNEAIEQFSHELSEQEFSMWFNIEYDSATQDSIHVRVPSSFYKDQLSKTYQKAIEAKLFDLSGKRIALNLVVTKPRTADSDTAKPKEASLPEAKSQATGKTDTGAKPSMENRPKERHLQLKPEYNFDSYVVGENNQFAANAAVAIASNPGVAYNPFLIYGGVGLGKTHLMQAIGNRAWELNPKLKIICISAEQFTNEFIHALSSHTIAAFKNRYRSVDILLLDDIHFFESKENSAEELFHTFNTLYDGNKQMVFTCDRPASELKNLSERLKSRFERGLKLDLQPPNYEMRCAILKRKIEDSKLSVPLEVIDIIAKNISTNVRDLESAVTTLVGYAQLVGKPITIESTQQLLKDVFSLSRHGNVTIDHIIRTVAEQFKVTSNDLKGKKRTKTIVLPRQVAMYIARDITEYSTTELGLEFGGRDHTTVMHSCQKIDELLKLDPTMEATIQKLTMSIKQSSLKT